MTTEARNRLRDCISALDAGTLSRGDLEGVLDLLSPSAVQDLLYLQCSGSAVTSAVLGISLIRNGEVQPEPETRDAYPYRTVLDAIRDGWRVIQFPNLALLMDEQRTYGLGCEFILER